MDNKNNPVISTDNLDVGYGKKIVIKDINIDAFKGNMICLLGPNGAGKTTILRTLSGLLSPVSGCVYVNGTNLDKLDKKETAKYMSVVLTERVSINLMTVYDVVAIGRSPYTNFVGRLSDYDKQMIIQSLETVDALHMQDRFFNELSDGEKQKVMIARALVQEPELIVLDEPTTHLDIRHKTEVVRILRKLVKDKGITVILSLHDIDLAIKGCQTLLLIKDGEIIDYGVPEDIIRKGSVANLYKLTSNDYNELMGSIEISAKNPSNDCFVIGGNGSGIRVYRALSREGYGLATGILQENDIDYSVAQSLCEYIIASKPFMPLNEDIILGAEELMFNSKCVIDTGVPIGIFNMCNAELIKIAAVKGKKIFSLRNKNEVEVIVDEYINKVTMCGSISELIQKVNEFIKEQQ